MGEYAKFSGREIKIGTCEDMYYLRASQRGMVDPLPGNVNVRSNDAFGCRFRFPWPDEDNCQPGGFTGDYERAIPVDVPMPEGVDHYTVQFRAQAGYLVSLPCPESKDASWLRLIGPDNSTKPVTIHRNGFSGAVKLVQQKLLADGRLVPVLQCGGCGAKWRVEDESDIESLVVAIRSRGDRDGQYWHTIADRILEGAGMALTAK